MLLAVCLVALATPGGPSGAPAPSAPSAPSPKASPAPLLEFALPPNLTPESAAKGVCQACHLFPTPDLLDRETWRKETLPRMMIRLGLAPQSVETHPEAALLKATGKFPDQPLIPMQVFDLIEAYYVGAAPAAPLPQDAREEIEVGIKTFEVVRPRLRRVPSGTTLVHINEAERRIYVGDAFAKTLEWFSPAGDYLGGLNVSNAPVALAETPLGTFVSMIGSFYPSEARKAAVVRYAHGTNGLESPHVVLDQLPRTVDFGFADFNGDGRLDFALCVFGNILGRFSWFENLGGDRFEEHVLIEKPGAVKCVVRDFNGDGKPDIAVLVAQETESLLVFENQGHGEFHSREVFHQHPLYGHTGFEVIDFNGDGRADFLVTNGDNGEYPSPTKKYHGIRVYEDTGLGQYRMAFFYPLNGAFKAVARDFDGDGDLDIAAISFFPDYDKTPEESFVYLENKGGMKFRAATVRGCVLGRWLTMDVGDIDGDGDLDIVLGSFARGPGKVPGFLTEDWDKRGPQFLILKNRTR